MPLPFRFLAACIVLMLPLPICEAAVTSLADGYSVRLWQTEDGLPQNIVTSAIQTRDGYLWFGTSSGLARFNGERFQVYNTTTPGLHDQRIECLFEDAEGTLWIGHETGAISRYRDGHFETVVLPSGKKEERMLALGSDEKGRLWAMRQHGGFDALDGSGLHLRSLVDPEFPAVMAWSRSSSGSIWSAENGKAAHLVDGGLQPIDLGPVRDRNYVLGVAAARDGGAWIVCEELVRKWKDGRWIENRGRIPWPNQSLSCCIELRDGTLAVGTSQSGLYLVFGGSRRAVHFGRGNGLPQDRIRFVLEDREGNLWVGAGSAGMVSIHPSAFSVIVSPDQWQGCPANAVAPSADGALWIGTDGAGLYRYSNDSWKRYGDAEGLFNPYISAVTESPSGVPWVGNFWWGSPYRLENGRIVRPPTVDEASGHVFALVAGEAAGEMLVGNRDGLRQLTDDRAKWLLKSNDTDAGVCAIALDGHGGIWCGLALGGIAHISDGKVETFRREDGLASNAVQCLWLDTDGTLWIGTADRGLVRLKDRRFTTLGIAQGLADDAICYILNDDFGYLWLSTHHGLQRVEKAELNCCADGSVRTISGQIYDQNDGLPTIEFAGGLQGAGCKMKDGRLCFASSKGVLLVDPSRIQVNRLPPPVVLESLLVDGKPVAPAENPLLKSLVPSHQRLEFRFGGLSYVAPSKVLFRYRLDGIDDTWVDAGAKRTAYYSRLPAGDYRFHVIACNNDGQWNLEGASLAFTVAPFIWQTWWFVGLCALLAAAAVALAVRHFTHRRMQRRIEQMERQHELERERARIAQDIHDDVGASLSRIAMLSQPARSELGEPARASAVLSGIYHTAHEVMQALDEIVWAVDPRHDELDSLVDYMGNFAHEFLSAAGLRCRLNLPVIVPACAVTAETRHSLFLAFKESLNNAVKHAAATEVRVSVEVKSDSVVITVTDDGCGFDPADTTQPSRVRSANGLRNMCKRLERIGGRCEIQSGKGRGTRVTLAVAVPSARPAPSPDSRPHRPTHHP
ncbi:hypothetical protein DB347_07345 [Opitutaceae bacterium EW11]|nr:hypothetical protein DB347_07345 [Opitutaceae bacterium EW11]